MTKETLYLFKVTIPIVLLTLFSLILIKNLSIVLLSFIVFYFLIYLVGCNLYHRYWSHKQLTLSKPVEVITAVLGLFAMVGDPINYSKTHRWHHAKTDTDDDPHSPIHGRWHAFAGWMFKPRKSIPVFIIRDLLKPEFQYLQTLAKYQVVIVWSTLVVVALVSVDAFVGLLLAMTIAFVFEMLVNAVSHDPKTLEIKNLWLLPKITMSSYHGFHHAHPKTIDKNDPAKWLMTLLSKM